MTAERRSMREHFEHISAMPKRWDRAAALEKLPEPLQSHVRSMVEQEFYRRKWARGEA